MPRHVTTPAGVVIQETLELRQRLLRLVTRVADRFDLDPGELDVLARLFHAEPPYELTPTALSNALLLTSGGLTKRLIRLEGRDLIRRRLDPGDRRSLLVALTESGEAKAREAGAAHEEEVERLFAPLSPEERVQLADLLRRLNGR